jgi:hypothetical protein
VSRWSDVTASSWAGMGQASVPLSRVPPFSFEGSAVLFRGCGVRAVQEWAAQCHEADTGLTAQ